jgi:hypothetical protein
MWLNFGKFFTLAQISNKEKVRNHSREHLDIAQESDLTSFFGDFCQSEKLSEIKPPLPAGFSTSCFHFVGFASRKLSSTVFSLLYMP